MARSEPLTAEMVLSKTKADSIQAVKNLNLWGNDIEVRIVTYAGLTASEANALPLSHLAQC